MTEIDDYAQRAKIKLKGPGIAERYHRNAIDPGRHFSFQRSLKLSKPTSLSGVARTAAKVADVCEFATAAGWRVRAIGSLWSLSDCMIPGKTALEDDAALLVRTSKFQFRYFPDTTSTLGYVTAGCNLHNVNAELEKIGLALRTSGSSDGQTVAGALSTGVHGAAFRFGAIHNFVRAYHLAVPGRHVMVARSPEELSKDQLDSFSQAVGVLKENRIFDAQLFDAISVSFGAFGVLLGVVLDADRSYALRVVRRRVKPGQIGRLVQAVLGDHDFSVLHADFSSDGDAPHHCQLQFDPFSADVAQLVVMYQRYGYKPPVAFEWPEKVGDQMQLIHDIWLIRDLPLTTAIGVGLAASEFSKLTPITQWGKRSDIFGDSGQRMPFHSFAVGVPIQRTVEVLDLVYRVAARKAYLGLGEIRFVKSSPAHLAINRFSPVTAVFGIDGVETQHAWDFTRALLDAVRREKIPFSYHWGKTTHLAPETPRENRADLDAVYGAALLRWEAARASLLGADKRTFDNGFMRRLGLSDS